MKHYTSLFMLAAVSVTNTAAMDGQTVEATAELAAETRIFPRSPQFGDQSGARFSPSVSFTPEFVYEWGNGSWRFSAIGFARLDAHDERRSHIDLREFGVLYLGNRVSAFAGMGKAFWGVTEVNHLVDIINQTDAVEDIDTEDKLGQPMVSVTLEGSWGYLDVYYLPYFRERTFPSQDARLRGPLPVANTTNYEAASGRWHQDFALRWSRQFDAFDIGTSFFRGTSREPVFVPTETATGPVLSALYSTIDQVGLDAQWTREATLWKLEAITRGGHGERFLAATLGVERTVYGVAGGASDLGLLAEFMYDGRDTNAPPTVFDRDVFVGFRWAFNDISDTSILGGPVVDYESGEILAIVEAQRRLGNTWRFAFEARLFANTEVGAVANALRRDGFVAIRLSRFL